MFPAPVIVLFSSLQGKSCTVFQRTVCTILWFVVWMKSMDDGVPWEEGACAAAVTMVRVIWLAGISS